MEIDVVGYRTLETFSKATKFNKWLYSKFSNYVGQRVLEIGSGIGNLTVCINSKEIYATDYSDYYIEILKQRFIEKHNITVQKLDARREKDFRSLKAYGTFDTVICCNVLEHIKEDDMVIQNFNDSLVEQGNLILLVPFSQWLYCNYDRNLGHCRRYYRKDCINLLTAHNFVLERIFLFNFFGGAGWLVFGKLLRQEHIGSSLMGVYDKCVPVFSLIEKYGTPFGASIICIAKKSKKT